MIPMIIPDKAIALFLLERGIEVRPPGKPNLLLDAAVAGIATSEGITGQASAHTAQQLTKNAKQDEWRSWKQWALSHPEWNDWYAIYQVEAQKIEEEKERARIEELTSEAEAAGFKDIQKYQIYKKQKKDQKDRKHLLMLIATSVVLWALGAGYTLLENKIKSIPKRQPQTTSQSTPISPKIKNCLEIAEARVYDGIDAKMQYQQDKANCWSD